MQSRSTTTSVLIAVLVILTFPIWIGLIAGFFGIIAGVFGAVFGVIGGAFGAVFGVIGAVFGGLGGLIGWMFSAPFHFGFLFGKIFLFIIAILLVVAITKRRV